MSYSFQFSVGCSGFVNTVRSRGSWCHYSWRDR